MPLRRQDGHPSKKPTESTAQIAEELNDGLIKYEAELRDNKKAFRLLFNGERHRRGSQKDKSRVKEE